MHNERPRILIVDDEPDLREVLEMQFELGGFAIDTAVDGKDACSKIEQNNYDIVLSDIRMPNMDGVALLQWVRQNLKSPMPLILLTGYADINTATAYELGATALVKKPYNRDDLIKLARNALIDRKKLWSEAWLVSSDIQILSYEQKESLTKSADFKLGQGGFSARCPHCADFKLGQVVQFTINFASGEVLEGQSVLRWSMLHKDDPEKNIVGMEILRLKPYSLELYTKALATIKSTAYIPKLELEN